MRVSDAGRTGALRRRAGGRSEAMVVGSVAPLSWRAGGVWALEGMVGIKSTRTVKGRAGQAGGRRCGPKEGRGRAGGQAGRQRVY